MLSLTHKMFAMEYTPEDSGSDGENDDNLELPMCEIDELMAMLNEDL